MKPAEHPTAKASSVGPSRRHTDRDLMQAWLRHFASMPVPTMLALSRSTNRRWTSSGRRPAILPRARHSSASSVDEPVEPIRSTARSAANLEFRRTSDHVNKMARKVAKVDGNFPRMPPQSARQVGSQRQVQPNFQHRQCLRQPTHPGPCAGRVDLAPLPARLDMRRLRNRGCIGVRHGVADGGLKPSGFLSGWKP